MQESDACNRLAKPPSALRSSMTARGGGLGAVVMQWLMMGFNREEGGILAEQRPASIDTLAGSSPSPAF